MKETRDLHMIYDGNFGWNLIEEVYLQFSKEKGVNQCKKTIGNIYKYDLWYEDIRIHFPFLDGTLVFFLTKI